MQTWCLPETGNCLLPTIEPTQCDTDEEEEQGSCRQSAYQPGGPIVDLLEGGGQWDLLDAERDP